MSAPGRAAPSALVIVDDDVDHAAIIQRVAREIAPALPIEVLTDGVRLAERLAAVPPFALVLADRLLDGREVFEPLHEVLRARPDLRAVVMSAALSSRDEQRALAAGAERAVEKPGRLAEWRALLAALLGGAVDRDAAA